MYYKFKWPFKGSSSKFKIQMIYIYILLYEEMH